MEVGNVFADEMVNFGLVALPPIIELFAMFCAPFLRAGDIANGCITC